MAQNGGEPGVPTTHDKLRNYLCMAFLHMPEVKRRLEDNTEVGVQEYYNKMSQLEEPADEIMIVTAATVLKRRIVVHPIFRHPYPFIQYNPEVGVTTTKGDFHLLLYSNKYFTMNVYKSIMPDHPTRLSLPGPEDPKNSTTNGDQNISQPQLEDSAIQLTDKKKADPFDDILPTEDSEKGSPEKSDSELLEIRRKKRRAEIRAERAAQQKKADLSN